MDVVEKDFAQRLLLVLKKILECKNVDDSYMAKILTSIDNELRTQNADVVNMHVITEWVLESIENWKKTHISLFEGEFVCKFLLVLSKYDKLFLLLQNKNILDDFITLLKNDLLKHTTIKIAFIKMMSVVLDHNSGWTWIKSSEIWKLIVSIYFSNMNLYVEREGILFFKKLIFTAKSEDSINENILQYVFLPMRENKAINKDKKLKSNILLFLKLLEIILRLNIFSQNDFHLKLEKICGLEKYLSNLIENSEQETVLEAASVSWVLYTILKLEDRKKLLSSENISTTLDLFNILVKQNQFNCIIKLGKYCQTLWSEMRIQMQYENTAGINFILIQLYPSLTCITMPTTDEQYDLFTKKLFTEKSVELKKFLHLFGTAIRSNYSSQANDLAVKSILSVITNLDSVNLKEAVLIFQAMLFMTKSLMYKSGYDLETSTKKFKKLGSSEFQNKSLLSATLNGISILLEKFKINWTDLEALGLFKITSSLLKISDLSCIVLVQTLTVVKIAILNCVFSNVILSSIHAYFESLVPVLHELLTNSSWEVRDSCIEIVIAIVELSGSKYPDFQQLLLEKDFPSILLDIVENDMESYVRATAIRALTIMTKIELLNPFSNDKNSILKIMKLVETESEGIVRREAALLIKEIYLNLNEQNDDLINLFYNVMGCAALCDLHWEVKINSLIFWEAVIQRMMGHLTAVKKSASHSTPLNQKITDLSNNEVKLELHKTLKNLSRIGCLHILLTILKDDCDMIVIKKSAEVLSHLLSILKHYNVIETDVSSSSTILRKRKNSDLIEYEKKKITMDADDDSNGGLLEESISPSSARSDKIIEDIVNDTDINLLKNVSSQSEETSNCHKSVFLKEIEVESFLKQMQGFDKDQFLESKQKWFLNVETDLTLTMNKINFEQSVNEINVMDCY